ncbi:MAG: type II toxin-antitoxin system ParD family antitoxin [Spirulina sp.]
MNIVLTPYLAEFVREKVNTHQYESPLEVIGEALRLLDQRDRDRRSRLSELQAKIQEGIDSSDRGELSDGEEVFAELEEDIRRIEVQIQHRQI